MWIVEKSPIRYELEDGFPFGQMKQKLGKILERQVQVHCTGKFRLVDPAGNVVETK